MYIDVTETNGDREQVQKLGSTNAADDEVNTADDEVEMQRVEPGWNRKLPRW